MSDLVKRLREGEPRYNSAGDFIRYEYPSQEAMEAADRIEQLERTLQETIKLMTEASREAGEWKGKYEAAGYPGTLDGWIEKANALEAENEKLKYHRKRLDARINQQRKALRINWVIMEERAGYRLAQCKEVRSRLLAIACRSNAKARALEAENARLRDALREIASGKFSGQLLMSNPPKDPAVERARAIMAAVEAEREACAKVADDRAEQYAHFANKHEGSPIGDSNTMRCGAATAIADAIRRRG